MVCFMIHSPERKSDGMILALVGAERNIRNVAAGITEKGLFVGGLFFDTSRHRINEQSEMDHSYKIFGILVGLVW